MTNFDPTKPVQTRDGRPARIICTDKDQLQYSIVALVRDLSGVEVAKSYTATGQYHSGAGALSSSDLVNIPERREMWLNVYPSGNVGAGFPSRARADEAVGSYARTACLHITYTEGEGL